MLNFRKTSFIKSAPMISERPEKRFPELVFVGKSNVGKSSLINALCENKNLAYTSGKPGHTRLLNYFLVDEKFYLVDAPGYGYTATGSRHLSIFSSMMEDYFSKNDVLKSVVFLLDSRHEPSKEDVDFYQYLQDHQLPYLLVMTKCDKLNQSQKAAIYKNLTSKLGPIPVDNIILTSATEPRMMDGLRRAISQLVG
ncbi:MAG: YihA family ribosome biogenesis GTP-binding protein [Methanomicrobia archaeon]|nr:YihA family ribosome biogenesis GTP-binding protein [Methanomicrobia archaeon]